MKFPNKKEFDMIDEYYKELEYTRPIVTKICLVLGFITAFTIIINMLINV